MATAARHPIDALQTSSHQRRGDFPPASRLNIETFPENVAKQRSKRSAEAVLEQDAQGLNRCT